MYIQSNMSTKGFKKNEIKRFPDSADFSVVIPTGMKLNEFKIKLGNRDKLMKKFAHNFGFCEIIKLFFSAPLPSVM